MDKRGIKFVFNTEIAKISPVESVAPQVQDCSPISAKKKLIKATPTYTIILKNGSTVEGAYSNPRCEHSRFHCNAMHSQALTLYFLLPVQLTFFMILLTDSCERSCSKH
jgi:hypothetical protein